MTRDDDVIAAAKTGDPQAWKELYLLHASRLAALLRLVPTGDSAHDHEDLAAYAWLQAAHKIASFNGTADSFGGWLYTIARNQGAHTRRRAAHPAATIPAGGSGDLLDVASETTDREADEIRSIAQRLSVLPEKQRQVIALIDVLGYDTASAAIALGMTNTAVRVNRHRALAKLRTVTTR